MRTPTQKFLVLNGCHRNLNPNPPCHAAHLEALPEDGLAAKAVALRDVATLAHELQLKCGGQGNTTRGGQLTVHDKRTCYTLAHELN